MNNSIVKENILMLEALVEYGLNCTVDERIQQAIENILADRERLEKENNKQKQQLNDAFDRGFIHNDFVLELKTKANKYDSLVEKIKEKISERRKRINKLHPASDCELIDDIEREIKVLQELLDTEKEEI